MWNNVWMSLEIMGKGMAGIFVSILFIMLFVWLLGRFLPGKTENRTQERS